MEWLPDEILLHICSFCDVPDLGALLQTCNRFWSAVSSAPLWVALDALETERQSSKKRPRGSLFPPIAPSLVNINAAGSTDSPARQAQARMRARTLDLVFEEGVCGTTHILKGHEKKVNCIDMDKSGRFIVSGSDDATVRIWDRNRLRQFGQSFDACTRTFRLHKKPVTAIKYDSNNQLIATGSEDKTVKLWSLKEGTVTPIHFGQNDAITALQLCGGALFSASADGTVYCADVGAGYMTGNARKLFTSKSAQYPSIMTLRGPSDMKPISSVDWCGSSGQQLISAHRDGHLTLWDIRQIRAPVFNVVEDTQMHRALFVKTVPTSSGRFVMFGGLGSKALNFINLADPLGGRYTWHGSGGPICDAIASDQTVITASLDYTIRIWKVTKRAEKLPSGTMLQGMTL